MTQDALFAAEDGLYVPLEPSRGYWTFDSMHGRSIVGLIGYEIDRLHGAPGMVPARFNVDMHRLPPFAPIRVETKVLRDGGRLRLVEAVAFVGDVEYARGQCQYLRPAEQPKGRVWTPEHWDAPAPETIAPAPDPERKRLAEMRMVKGGFNQFGPRHVWMREFRDLILGVPLTPWARIVMAADFASPWAHMSDAGINYINTDVVVQLHRLPEGEFIGFEATGHEASQGIAVGNCRIYDREGPIGYISATALTNQRRR